MATPTRQLVGSVCVHCEKRIGSVLEGDFCSGCGCAVHNECSKPKPEGTSDGCCPACGAQVAKAELLKHQEQEKRKANFDQPTYPVSNVCPKCGDSNFLSRRSKRWISFTNDRECTKCKTRYVPPTPIWAAVIFVLAGIALGGFGALSLAGRVAHGSIASLMGMMFDGLIVILGLLALLHGLRCLMNPGKV